MNAPRRVRKPLTARQVALAQLDMFGEVPVTRQDVYAWLMAVVQMDPESFRAADYIRNYRVLDKIVAAKLDGTFEQIVGPARASARFRELDAAGTANPDARNTLGVGEHRGELAPAPLPMKPVMRAPRRPPEVIARERERAKAEKRARGKLRTSVLNRWLPSGLPSFQAILEDLGQPDAEAIGAGLQVHPTTVRRWLRDGDAPHAIKLALFWMTRWGISTVEVNAQNDAINSERIARLHELEAEKLRDNLRLVERIADFGSANDPLPNVQARHQPAETAEGMSSGADVDERSAPLPPGEQAAGALRRRAQGGAAPGGRGAARPAAEERPRRGPEASSDSDDTGRNACAA
ncbi:hypothetical protein [Ramlibacter humi]|uniref:Uncharacterized protein n=1 Tax=Ramlibacter humi TaxID=2530451 RepID=A0A4Z0BVM5_9BURK|nr:hypothetical protein [Ramlibacter humi]TFZ02095.1 hypothetical protein EZ216_13045 [Ramlibacter humi]